MQRRLIIIFLLIMMAGVQLFAQRTADILAYIATYKDFAISEMKRTGVPAAITLAQGIHETEAGTSDLVKKSNNHFGIKCKAAWTGDKVFHDDDALGECFRSYNRPEESYMDHSDFLRNGPRYAFLFAIDPSDYEGWAYGLKKAGYATNIRYSQVLIKLIQDFNLQDYTLIALGKKPAASAPVLVSALQRTPVTAPALTVSENNVRSAAAPSYPQGTFYINNTKVIYADNGTAWLAIAEKYQVPLSQLWDFNDLEKDDDILQKAQLVYLQRKRKAGAGECHVVQSEESLYDICQSEGIRLESLLEYNYLNGEMMPAPGEKLYLQHASATRPMLVTEQKSKGLFNNTVLAKPLPAGEPLFAAGNRYTDHTAVSKDPVITTHLVGSKETLYSISRKYGIGVDKIKEWNRLDSLTLKVGQPLIIYKSSY